MIKDSQGGCSGVTGEDVTGSQGRIIKESQRRIKGSHGKM